MPRMPRPIFTQEWQDGAARAVETAMPAVLSIYRLGERVYVPEENAYVAETIYLYGGEEGAKGRVQPLRSSRYEPAPMDSTYSQVILVSVPIAAAQGVDFQVADIVRVLSSPLNTINTKYRYTVTEISDSSNPFERTLQCVMNLETRVEDA